MRYPTNIVSFNLRPLFERVRDGLSQHLHPYDHLAPELQNMIDLEIALALPYNNWEKPEIDKHRNTRVQNIEDIINRSQGNLKAAYDLSNSRFPNFTHFHSAYPTNSFPDRVREHFPLREVLNPDPNAYLRPPKPLSTKFWDTVIASRTVSFIIHHPVPALWL